MLSEGRRAEAGGPHPRRRSRPGQVRRAVRTDPAHLAGPAGRRAVRTGPARLAEPADRRAAQADPARLVAGRAAVAEVGFVKFLQ